MMLFWAKKGVDGFRMDVINLISKDQRFPNDDGSVPPGDGRKFYTDGPRVHEYIKAMYEEVFGPYEMVTVGEMSSTTLEHCIRYSSPKEREFSMTFNFHHLKVDYPNGQKWELMPYDFEAMKSLFTEWQTGMQKGRGWNALFFNNHDQPRALSRFTDDKVYRVESAKLLATTLHGLQGTPYVYQGEEIGMPNPVWKSIDEFRDIESLNMYRILCEQGKSPKTALSILQERSRDNSRTPMQWDDSRNAGFTTGTPWLKVDERYSDINVQKELANPDSIFHHYRKLIALRKDYGIFIEGVFKRLDDGHPEVFAYARTGDGEALVVVSNFSSKEITFRFEDSHWAELSSSGKDELLIGNTTEKPALTQELQLSPYASYMWLIR